MKKTILKLALIFFTATANSVFAADEDQACDDDTLHIIAKHLNLDEMVIDFVSQACKATPGDKNIMLVALAIDTHGSDNPNLGDQTYTEVVAKVNKTKKKVISIFKEEVGTDVITDFGEYSLALDTARYQLNANTRAFGVRYVSSARGASCASGYWSSQLTLYVEKGRQLMPIMGREMYIAEALKGCIGMATKDNLIRSANLALSVLKTKANRHADLLLTATIEVQGAGENSQSQNAKDSLKLVFNGNYYVLEKQKCYPWWVQENNNNKPLECGHD